MATTVADLPSRGIRGRIPAGVKRGAAVTVGAALVGLLAGHLVLGGQFVAIFGLIAVFIPVAMWRKPEISPVVMLSCALLIEQFHGSVEPTNANAPGAANAALAPVIPITGKLPFFQGLGSLHLDGSDLLILLIFAIVAFKVYQARPIPWPHSLLSRGVKYMMFCLLLGLAIGASHHFNMREALQEARPYVYLGSAFVLTALLIRSRAGLQWMLWTLVIAEAIKSVQGVIIYIGTRSWAVPPEAVLGHEEAYFFDLFLLLVAGLWMFDVRGRLRTVATWLLPLVIFADLVNNRRAAWLMLGGGLITLMVIGYVALPNRRRVLGRMAMVLVAMSAVYFPLYWNKDGTLAQPARAIKSSISPDPRDAASDLYRIEEDANLEYNIAQGGLIGKGFGIPIDYALPIANIQAIDPGILYIPHNGVLYVLMRMGLLGGIAQWCMIGTGILVACRLAKSGDKQIGLIGALVACALVAYALEGATDQGFYFYRIAFVTGGLLGMAEAGRRMLAARSVTPAPTVVEA